MKKGLILEGGAMRGMFTCGVMDVMLENGIEFDGAAGISAGAVFGCNYKSKQVGRAIRYNKRFGKDKRYCSLRSLLKTGDLYNVEFCYHTVPDELDVFDRAAFKANPMEFYVGASNAVTGKPEFHLCSDGGPLDIEWMRASASMPVVSRVVQIDEYRLLDGGIVCPVPYRFMKEQGYDRNVIVLTQPKGYRKKKASMMWLIKSKLKQYPAMVEAMRNRPEVYNAQMDELDKMELEDPNVLIIRPEESLGISRTEGDPNELERVYQLGREAGEKRLEEVKAFLAKE